MIRDEVLMTAELQSASHKGTLFIITLGLYSAIAVSMYFSNEFLKDKKFNVIDILSKCLIRLSKEVSTGTRYIFFISYNQLLLMQQC